MTTHCRIRQTIMGRARSTSSHSFRLDRARARKMDRNMLPMVSISWSGYSTFTAIITLRMTTAVSMAPM